MKIELPGKIDQYGKLTIFQNDQLKEWICGNSDKQIVLSISIKKNDRSNNQNKYYWKIVVALVQERMNYLGNDFSKEETHDFLKKEFNWTETELKEGHWIKVPRSTTKLTTIEFMDYVLKIQQFGADMLDIYIPDPEQQGGLNFNH
jgi:hypothetical protein